jgi:alkanesulfonate monooxygenase SsuD/methylene tetrahydromethanopterin reductase-like flavin-dependent oxidoreductase (luciferase family)
MLAQRELAQADEGSPPIAKPNEQEQVMKIPVKFGLNVDPNAGGLTIAARIAAIADDNGLELVGVQDHPYNADFTDTLTTITWLAARTGSVHFFPNVANLPLRPPAMLAKQAATIDVLSGGRFELGLGAGAFANGIAGMGGPGRTPGQARGALSEAIDIIRASWAGQPFSYRGTYYDVPDVRPGPRPAHDIGLWLGVSGPRAARLVGAKADGWSVSAPYLPPARLPDLNAIITGAAHDAGRDPGSVTRLYNVMGLITPEDRDAFHGPAERWVQTLASLHADSQMNAFVFWPSGDRERQSRLFAEQVVPAARRAIADSVSPGLPRK